MKLAQECRQKSPHLVPEWFADLDLFHEDVEKWRWYASVSERGCNLFAHRACPSQTIWELSYERPGSKRKYYKEGNKCFLARVICENCRAMFQVEASSGNKLTQAADKGLLEFFLLRR